MRDLLLICILALASSSVGAQETRQIKARKIRQASNRTEQIQKGEKEISFVSTRYDKREMS